ncbi:D-alanyl-D-alanine carboxypeptidase [Microcoleus vaginatus]|uniref:D-alanyl-D-alanine carboxypeptidase n=1 Tax=Microcoleus vaginatus TaxID=119532 RepID=UPI001688F96D|nr:D-alanyl-D-alanine carboxypeptidase [Microcoleus sp. FACHB-84]MBD2012029.1 D-alanyl-D-alanine carboxypeptidase [Microcoleus sp. FACHB-45]
MLDLFSSGIVSLWLDMAGVRSVGPNAASVLAWRGGIPGLVVAEDLAFGGIDAANPDLPAEATVREYLKDLKDKNLIDGNQGIWVQAGMVPLVSQQGKTLMPGASLTKIATSLASLETWGPDYQFETRFRATGPISNGVLQGDLVVSGGGDPLFVWEEAIAVGNALNQMGIERVAGNLVVTGNFRMNYQSDPLVAGDILRQALDGSSWPQDVVAMYSKMAPGTRKPQVTVAGSVIAEKFVSSGHLLLKRRSLPLAEILKQMNVHSDNEIAQMLADDLGGAKIVQQQATWAAGVPEEELQLVNGSGLGVENQMSPRAACGMMQAIGRNLQTTGLTIADLFPVSGRDKGTLEYRHIPPSAVVKTGTLDTVIALAGAIPTRDRGLVWFAIINRGTDWDSLRAQQDIFLQKLVQQWGTASILPLAITPHIDGARPALGAANRSDILVGG